VGEGNPRRQRQGRVIRDQIFPLRSIGDSFFISSNAISFRK